MNEPIFPIQRIRKLTQVDRGLTDQRTVRAIRSTHRLEAESNLPNATSLASAVAEFVPDLAKKQPLRIAIASFEAADGIDDGRWFQIAAPLLGRTEPLNIDLVVTGPKLHRDEAPSSVGHLLRHVPGAPIYRGQVSAYIATHGLPDVFFLCHPNLLESEDELHSLDWVESALEAGIPVLGWSFSALERELFCAAMEANGWGTPRKFDAKVYGVTELDDWHPLEHGRYLWQLCPRTSEALEIRSGRIQAMIRLSARHGDALNSGRAHPWCGKVRAMPGYPGGVAFSVDEEAVDLAAGVRLIATAGHGATAPSLKVVGKAQRWSAVSLEEAKRLSPVEIVELVDRAGAKYLFEEGASLDEMFSDRFIDEITEGADPETASAMRRMVGMMKAKTGVETGDPLFVAAQENNVAVIKELVASGAVVNRRDASGRTPLITAAMANAVDAVEALLDAGADVDMVLGFNHMTPAQVALTHGALGAMKVLLMNGANIDHVTPFGQRLLRTFLESGQGGAAAQAWYREGVASGRIPEVPTSVDDD